MNELQPIDNKQMSVQNVKQQFELVNELYKTIMITDEHYGKIPGTKKDTLFKAGAEKLNILFKLVPKIERETKTDLGNGHREIEMDIGLYHRDTGAFWGSGTGSCSTMESKFRYRDNKIDMGVVPQEYWKDKTNPQWKEFTTKKVDGTWRFFKTEGKTENPDIADIYNTVRKMCYKRALVSATITATGVSDIFTQDLEENRPESEPKSKPEESAKKEIVPDEDMITQKLRELPEDIIQLFHELKYTKGDVKKECITASWDWNNIRETLQLKKDNPFSEQNIPF